ncbi:MAG TPA: VWA domain-containing protein [Vicinamibacterales bacterium]|jgi:Ca-activated chloride channel homolog|nr:VWA domain-containing protein [Vicinamibacterales bacterium]
MQLRGFRRVVTLVVILGASPFPSIAQDAPIATFKSGVDLVSVSAVVRDKKGRVVRSLTQKDFVVMDGGAPRKIVELHADETAPASVALLVDGSGSMAVGAALDSSRDICKWVLTTLDERRDDAALLSFDTRLLTLRDFTGRFENIRTGLGELGAFGSTSLYDAIAGASAIVAQRARNRRAVIVLTDGADTASSYTPDEVAWIASTIDVPVYVFAVAQTASPEAELKEKDKAQLPSNPLADLARSTGGDYFIAGSPALAVNGIIRLVEELRHQYLIAFEPASGSGMRQLEIKTKKNNLRVSSRRWYTSGNSVVAN